MMSSKHTSRDSVAVRRVFADSGEVTDTPSTTPLTTATVSTIMSRTVICVQPTVGADLLAQLFLEHGVSGFPVVDEVGRPIGVVSKTDLLRYVHEHGIDLAQIRADEAAVLTQLGAGYHAVPVDGGTVQDLMMPIVFALPHDAMIAKAAALMAGEGIHRVPILDDDGVVCGIVSSLDLVRWLADLAGYPVR